MFGNLLNKALTIIPKQQFLYSKYIDTRINELGVKENCYAKPIEVEGSVQPIQANMYQQLGLDFSKNYITVYCSLDIRNFDKNAVFQSSDKDMRDHNQIQTAPDRIIWNSKKYLVENVNDWYAQDGWKKVIAVEEEQGANIGC